MTRIFKQKLKWINIQKCEWILNVKNGHQRETNRLLCHIAYSIYLLFAQY